jgi:hypothetical protein
MILEVAVLNLIRYIRPIRKIRDNLCQFGIHDNLGPIPFEGFWFIGNSNYLAANR